jgi:hypothetical protein
MDDGMFYVIESIAGKPYYIVCHKVTKVMYAVSTYGQGAGVFSLLVNPDGKPMLYEGDNVK